MNNFTFKRVALYIAALALGVVSSSGQEIAKWKGFRASATTFTFDDGCATQMTYAVPLFDKYGYQASFYAVTNWANGGNGMNWSQFGQLLAKGHEVGSHSDTHGQTMPDSEISSSKNTIEQKLGNKVLTVTYPNCNEPSETELKKHYIGGRICDGQVMGASPSNYYRLSSIICGNTGSINTASAMSGKMSEAVNKGGWCVFLIHEVESGSGYSPTATSAIEGALQYAKNNDSKVWVATFRDAILYSKERDASKLQQTASSPNSVTYSLTNSLDVNTYNYPLSVRCPMPDGWSEVSVSQNDEEVESSVSGGYIYFDAVPNNGSILVQSGSAAVADPQVSFTSPATATEVCAGEDELSVAWTIDGEVGSAYTLKWNAGSGSDIAVSGVKASSEWTNDDGTFSWSVDNILSDDGANGENSRWGAKTAADEWVELTLGKTATVGGVTIDEFTEYGTVTSFKIQYDDNGLWKDAYTGTTIGVEKNISFDAPVSTTKIRFYIVNGTNGANINYISVHGVASVTLKTNITTSGSYIWSPAVSLAGSGTLTIEKESGKKLATSVAITVKNCSSTGTTTPSTGGNVSSGACADGGGYTGPSCDGTGSGAYYTGIYRNLFSEYLGKTEAEVDSKIESIWNHFFGTDGNKKVYYETNDGMAYIYDTGNSDVRTEGMSYGMMICVQLDHKEQFDKIWKWAKKYMQYKAGNGKEGLFAWQCDTQGNIKGTSCAPDGEAYFLTALFFASHRWGNDGEINYEKEAQYLIKCLIDKPGRGNGQNSPIFNLNNYLITFGETSYDFTDPSYNLPGFFELWAKWTDTNKDFWEKTAGAARNLLYNSSNSNTGLYPDYSQFDGSPYKPSWCSYESNWYKYDAIRCPMNVGMDYNWFGTDNRQPNMISKILKFFKNDGYKNGHFSVEGTAQGSNYNEGMTGANGVGVFALPESESALAKEYVQKLWSTNPPSGQWRYYNGMVYMLSMLHVSGKFKIWKPAPEIVEKKISGPSPVEFNGKQYTESVNFCEMIDCKQYNVEITVEAKKGGTGVEEVANETSLQITPNPASTSFSVVGSDEINTVSVYDLSGMELIRSNSNEVSVASLANGNYIVKVMDENGNQSVFKLMVKH